MTTATRSKRDPEGRKRAIVDATVELIAELGVNDVNHRKIAERAGVPLGATTQYFASRGDLVRAALEQIGAEYDRDLAQLDADLEVSVDPVSTVAAFFLHYLDDADRSRAALAFFLANLHSSELSDMPRRWNQQQATVLAKHFDHRFAEAAGIYAYGLYIQGSSVPSSPSETDTVWALRRLGLLHDRVDCCTIR